MPRHIQEVRTTKVHVNFSPSQGGMKFSGDIRAKDYLEIAVDRTNDTSLKLMFKASLSTWDC